MTEAWGDFVDPAEYPGREQWPGDWQGLPWAIAGEEPRHAATIRASVDLDLMRTLARVLCERNSSAIGALGNLTNYVIGTGFAYKAVSRHRGRASRLVRACNQVIGEFIAENNWIGSGESPCESREREAFRRARRDGDAFIALSHVGGGHAQCRFMEPSQIVEPDNPRELERRIGWELPGDWSYGVHTDDDDTEEVHGYAVKRVSPAGRDTVSYWPATRMVHVKLNVDSCVKRGLSDFYPVARMLERSAKLLSNVVEGGAILSAIAWICEHAAGATQGQIQSMLAANAARTVRGDSPAFGGPHYRQHYAPGQVIHVPSGQQYKSSPLAERGVGDAMVTINQAVLRAAGSRWSMPEFMISGDASNNAYASTLAAESPFTKYCQASQSACKGHFAAVFWKVLRISHAAGRFDHLGYMPFEQLQAEIALAIEAPIVEARDRNVETNRRKILRDNGVISDETWSTEEGYDFDRERERGARVRGMTAPFAGGDQPGQPVEDQSHPQQPPPPTPAQEAIGTRFERAARLLWEGYP